MNYLLSHSINFQHFLCFIDFFSCCLCESEKQITTRNGFMYIWNNNLIDYTIAIRSEKKHLKNKSSHNVNENVFENVYTQESKWNWKGKSNKNNFYLFSSDFYCCSLVLSLLIIHINILIFEKCWLIARFNIFF